MWTSFTQLEASLPPLTMGVLPMVGDMVAVRAGVLKAPCVQNTNCRSYLAAPAMSLPIASPLYPVSPVVTLVAPSVFGRCEDVVLDPTASLGNSGRPWSSVTWSVNGEDCQTQNCSFIEWYLNTRATVTNKFVVVPNKYIVPGLKYSFSVQLVNFLKQSGSAVATFTLSDQNGIPLLSIVVGCVFPSIISSLQFVAVSPFHHHIITLIPSC